MSLIISRVKEESSFIKEKYNNFMKEWRISEKIDATEIIKNFDIFFFDCDGVLWHGNKLMEDAVNVIKKLFEAKKKVYFITNNSTKSRKSFVEKFHKLGFTFVSVDNILCTSYTTAKYLCEKNAFKSKQKKIYVIGEQGICDELDVCHLEWIGSSNDNNKSITLADNSKVEVDNDVGAVVVGIDFHINYYKIQYAQLCINELDAEFIATNKDALGNFTSAQKWAGTGTIVSSIEAAVSKKPIIIGKPSTYMVDQLLNELKVDYSKVIMIGDRLETDIKFAKNCKIKSILVSTGITTSHIYLHENPEDIKPDYIMISIADFF